MRLSGEQFKRVFIGILVFCTTGFANAQKKETIAVISIDTKELMMSNTLMASMVSLELEKLDIYEVLDKYDVANILKQNKIDPHSCFGKSEILKAGNLLKVDRVLSGSVERFGDKIIIVLRMINIKEQSIEKADVMEYINQESEMQLMLQISINNIMGLENDPVVVDILSGLNEPITIARTKANLSGPRFGFSYTTGTNGDILRAEKSVGGFNMLPVNTMFGYQHEVQFVSAGDFQALFEFIGAINGVESGRFVPSLTTLIGTRFNRYGLEFGFGPVFRITQMATGFYDDDNNWHLKSEAPVGDYQTVERLDSRGEYRFSTGLIIAVGKTFRSGYLNFPVNLYFSPGRSSEGHVIGVNFGFNIAKRQSFTEKE